MDVGKDIMGKQWEFLYVIVNSMMLCNVNTLLFTDVEFANYDYPSQVTLTNPFNSLPRPPLPSLPSENEEDTQYLSLRWQNEDPLPGKGIFVSSGKTRKMCIHSVNLFNSLTIL